MVNIEVAKTGNESNANVLRRFTRQVQGAKILNVAKEKRYKERNLSDFKKKMKALLAIERRKKIEELTKLGKIATKTYR